jgi:putative transposase
MPRLPREYSETSVYHIMIRGNAKQDIFVDSQDKRKIIRIILQKRVEELFNIYAFCIMNNHAHIVAKELKESISKSMKRITTSYAFYFNAKYKRVGHVFQDRFKSEVIKDDSYLLSVIRYVHNNPEKARIATKEKYPWSSYHEYISTDNRFPEVTEILKMFAQDKKQSIKIFQDFSDKIERREFLDMSIDKQINKENVNQHVEKYLKNNYISKINLKDKKYLKQRNDLIKNIIVNSDLSKRAIAEAIGINRETVRRVSKEPSP